MRILLLSPGKNYHSIKRLNEEMDKRSILYDIIPYTSLYLKIDKKKLEIYNKEELDFNKYDYIIPRSANRLDHFLNVLASFQNEKFKVLNQKYLVHSRGTFKNFYEYINLSKYDIPLIPSILTAQEKLEINDIKDLGIDFPVVVKTVVGIHRKEVRLVSSIDEINSLIEIYSRGNIIIQKYVKSDYDIRVIVLNGEVLGAMSRKAKEGEFRSNFRLGGEVEAFETDSAIKEIALNCAKALNLDFCGIDLIRDVDEYKVIEVNSAPQFEAFEQATDVNVAGKLIEFAVNSVKEKS